ncbi:MAG: hypothetical protein KIG18_05135, partial [Candidatus Methanomethylophilaceae archaeon]|nr:hypothetical protein [Candidatus Methanomethylophilaceae archaeon]
MLTFAVTKQTSKAGTMTTLYLPTGWGIMPKTEIILSIRRITDAPEDAFKYKTKVSRAGTGYRVIIPYWSGIKPREMVTVEVQVDEHCV